MDYISESERLKLYYRGLARAGSDEHIAAAHPDLVSVPDDPDITPELREINEFVVHDIFPLYYKLAYVTNNRFIHEDLPDLEPEPQRIWTADEIFTALQALATYAVPELIRTIGSSSDTLVALQQAFDADDRAAFARIIDTSQCDLALISTVCEYIWPRIKYYIDPTEEELFASLDVVASLFRDDKHPISRSSQEMSEAVEPFFEDGDEEDYCRKATQYNSDMFDYMCEYYRDNYKLYKPKERKQIEPIILHGGGSVEAGFHLPDDYFSLRLESGDSDEYFGLHPDIINAGPARFEELVNGIAQMGYIDSSPAVLHRFAYRFSGRMRPEKLDAIEWHDRNGKSYELIYLVRNMTAKTSYRKMCRFFTGPDWPKDRHSSYARGADYHLKEYLHRLYPTLPDQL